MAFTLGRFLKQVPPPALQAFLADSCAGLAESIDWDQDERPLAKAIEAAILALPDEPREAAFTAFERVERLADEVGQRAVRSVAGREHVGALDQMESAHERALWLLVNDEPAFRRAEEARFSEYYRFSRMWEGFRVPEAVGLDPSAQRVEAFRNELQRLFRERDGSGRSVEVEIFERSTAGNGEDRQSIFQVTGYLEGTPASIIEFENREVCRRVQHPAIEVAITYVPLSGEIDVLARGGRPVRQRLARIFVDCLLECGGTAPEKIPLRQYRLAGLERRRPFPTDPEDGIRLVRVTKLRLRPYCGPGEAVTLEVDRRSEDTIYDRAHAWFGSADPLRGGFRVDHAELAVEVRGDSPTRSGPTMKVTLTHPHGCNLKDRTQWERLLGEKYLHRWGLVEEDGGAAVPRR